jgi:Protein of unknown function (DUF732)
MRKHVTRIGYTMIGITLALLAAPAAHADTDTSFVTAARALGMQQSPDYVIREGRSACLLLNMGSTPAKLADRMTTTGLGPDQAHQFIALSVHDYCPQYNGQVGG